MLKKTISLIILLIFQFEQTIAYEKATNIMGSLLLASIPTYIVSDLTKSSNRTYKGIKLNKYLGFFTYFISSKLIYDYYFWPQSLEGMWIPLKADIDKQKTIIDKLPILSKRSSDSLIEEIKILFVDEKLPLVSAVNTLIKLKKNTIKANYLSNLFLKKINAASHEVTKFLKRNEYNNLSKESQEFAMAFNQEFYENLNRIILTIKEPKNYLLESDMANKNAIFKTHKKIGNNLTHIRNLLILMPSFYIFSNWVLKFTASKMKPPSQIIRERFIFDDN